MSFLSLLVGFILLFLSVLHPIVYRPIARKYDTDFSCLIISVWLVATTAPVVMVYSALKYKEKSVKNQLVFGVLAILFALPIIFLK